MVETAFFANIFSRTTVSIMNIPRSKSRIETFIYPCLVKVQKIWPEQRWQIRNSVLEGVAIRGSTA